MCVDSVDDDGIFSCAVHACVFACVLSVTIRPQGTAKSCHRERNFRFHGTHNVCNFVYLRI